MSVSGTKIEITVKWVLVLKRLANEQQFKFMEEDQLWFGVKKVWTHFCIWCGSLQGFFLFEFICGHLQPILAWFTRGNIIVTLWNLSLNLRKVSFLEIIYWIRYQEFEWQPSEEVSCGIPAHRDRGRDGELQASLASKPEPCQKQTDEPWNKNPTAPNKMIR